MSKAVHKGSGGALHGPAYEKDLPLEGIRGGRMEGRGEPNSIREVVNSPIKVRNMKTRILQTCVELSISQTLVIGHLV